MVKVTDYNLRTSSEGKSFFSLVLQGGIEILRSASGNVYATARKVNLPTTFNEEGCKALIGSELPGQIVKEVCEPYYYEVQGTGEILTLSHRFVYVDSEELSDESFQGNPPIPQNGMRKAA